MKWRDPAKELPVDGQTVWVLLAPHKDRGSLLKSAMSMEIVCGEVYSNENVIRVENMDELGMGSIGWYLVRPDNFIYDESYGIAWLPVEELPLPGWSHK